MAWYPEAIRKEIIRHRTAIVGPRRYMLHTAVSAASSLFNYFNQSGNPTSHFYVRADGIVEQYVSTAYRAPAQLEGNRDSIGVETQDLGGPFPSWSGSNVPAWTDAQVKSLARIGAWLHATHGIKLQLCPNSRPGSEGFAYHRQGIDPWRVSGGELWSTTRGKVCPGDRRVKQVPDVLARAKQIIAGSEEGDMPLNADDKEWFRFTIRAIIDEKVPRIWAERFTSHITRQQHGAGSFLTAIHRDAQRALATVRVILDTVAQIPGVDGAKLAAEVRAAEERISAEDVADEFAEQSGEAADDTAVRDAQILAAVEAVEAGEQSADEALRKLAHVIKTEVPDGPA